MLELSASESLYGGQFTLSTQLIKPSYLIQSFYAPVMWPERGRGSATYSLNEFQKEPRKEPESCLKGLV